MRKLLIAACIAMLTIATTDSANAQSGNSNLDRDAMIGQLETMLNQLKSERELSSATDASDSDEVEGALSTGGSDADMGMLSDMVPYSDGSMEDSYGGQIYDGQSNGNQTYGDQSYGNGYSTGTHSNSMGSGYGLPVESYAAGQTYPSLPMQQSAPMYEAAPMIQQAPVYQSAPIVEQAPMSYAAPIAAPAPAPQIIVIQQPAPSFGPTFLNYVSAAPLPMPFPRRHGCCLFGR